MDASIDNGRGTVVRINPGALQPARVETEAVRSR